MKAYKPTRKLVDSLLALERYADEVIKYAASNPVDAPGSLINTQALARVAEDVVEHMNTHLK